MSRLSAGGRGLACRRSTPPNCARPNCASPPKRLAREPARRYRFRSICPRAVGSALALWAAAVPVHATGGDAPAPARTEARTVVGFAAPLVPLAGSDKARDGRAIERPAGPPTGQDAHWTLRAPVYVRTSAGEAVGSVSGQAEGAGRGAGMRTADVAMFSWKEIAAVGLVLAFVLGVLLAFTGGGARGASQRSAQRTSKDY